MGSRLFPSVVVAASLAALFSACVPVHHEARSGVGASAPLFQDAPPPRGRSKAAAPDVQVIQGVEVHLADVLARVPRRPSGVELPIEPAESEETIRMPITPEEAERLRRLALRAPFDPDIQVLSPEGFRAPTPGVSFDSLDYSDNLSGSVPPDPELAVGPDHVIAVVNTSFQIYDKTGTALTVPIPFATFLSGLAACTGVFDPNAVYDEETGRFILGIDADGTDYCFAVAATNNPVGSWYLYSFQTAGPSEFFDFPHLGVGDEALFVGANMFDPAVFLDSRAWAVEKAPLLTGGAATVVMKTVSVSGDGTPQPANLHGYLTGTWPPPGQPHYIMTEVFDGANHTVWSWSDPFGANLLVNEGTVDLEAASGVTANFPVNVPQSGMGSVQANDWRGHQTEYRNGHLWTAQTIACNPGGPTVDCVRWAEIDPAPPGGGAATVVQAGVFASSGQYRFFPSLAVNDCGDMAIGYSRSSNSTFPGAFVNGRLFTDPPGTVGTEATLQAGLVNYQAFDPSPRRWGDYTGMTIAPDGTTFWYLGEYSRITGQPSGRWATRIGSFTFSTCAPTVALVSGLRGFRTPGGLLLEWETTSEAGTVAYSVERQGSGGWEAIGRPLTALADAPQGGVYRVLDAEAPGRGAVAYRLVELESSGKRRIHGPFTVRPEAGAPDSRAPAMRRPRTASAGRDGGSVRSLGVRDRRVAGRGSQAVAALDVRVAGRGIVRLDAAELAAAAGLPTAEIEGRIASYGLSIRRGGEEVAYLAAPDGSEALLFVPGIDSLYTSEDVLQIALDAPGLAMGRWTSRPGAPAPGGSFTSHVDFEEDVFPATSATRETDVDHWYWQGFAAGDPELGSRAFELDTPDAVAGGTARLTVRTAGAAVGPADLDHAARVLVGGVEVGVAEWADLERHEETFTVDAGLLGATTTVAVEALDDAPDRLSMFFLDGFALDYERAYRARGGSLELVAEGGEQITVEHLAASAALAFDVSDTARPLLVADAAADEVAGDHRLTFNPRAPGVTYLVVEPASLLEPAAVDAVGPFRIDATAGAEYVVLTTADMLPAAEALAAYRESTGLTSLAVDVREIYDRFRDGRPDPWAIRDFVRWASESWSVAPRYLVLAGAGSLDPRDLLGHGKNRLTPVLLGTAHGLAAADSVLVEPEEGTASVAVGRLPVRDATQLAAYLAKLQAFESGGAGPGGVALAVADDPDGAGDFPTQSAEAVAHLPSTLDVQTIDLSRSSVAEARAALFGAWSGSPYLINWVGHGGVDRWAAEGLLTAADVPALGPVAAPPIVSAWTCVIGRFELPAFQSLGEALVLEPGGGGIAVLSPSGVSASGQAHVLNRLLFDALGENERLGDAWLSALGGFAAAGGDRQLARVYGLLGDPALRVD